MSVGRTEIQASSLGIPLFHLGEFEFQILKHDQRMESAQLDLFAKA